MGRESRRTWCGLCHARCGIVLEIEDGRAVSVRGDRADPFSRGATCKRGRMMVEHLHHPDRLDHPLRRGGSRGGGTWQRVTWQEALDEIAARLDRLRERHGAETLAFSRGTYRTYHWDARRFFNLFGSPNITGANAICHCPSVIVDTAVNGAMPRGDLEQCACAVIWGSCRSTSSPVQDWPRLVAAKKRGAKVITVDPRRTREAEMADLWLRVRPGTDAALMLAWLHVICEEDLIDREFVEHRTVGFEEVAERARAYPPARVAEITSVPERDIVAAARLYATTRPGVITWGQGVDKLGPSSTAAMQARAILRAVTGNLDVDGGERLGGAERPSRVVSNLELEMNDALLPAQRAKILGGVRHGLFTHAAWDRLAGALRDLPASYLGPPPMAETVCAHPFDVFRAIGTGEPYPVRALLCQAANPLLTLADPARTLEALRAVDLLVVMDYYMTPTAALADFVLPAACTVERDDLDVSGSRCVARPRGIDPLGERRSDYELWMELGRRLGQTDHWPWDSVEQVCDHRLAPLGMTFRDLVEKGPIVEPAPAGRSAQLGFGTPSGKVELRCSLLADLGYDPLPSYAPLPRETSDEYPLLLITGSSFEPMYHSEQRQWPSARKMSPDPIASLHPETAAPLGVPEGGWVGVETGRGSARFRARLTDKVPPGVVDAQHGWWFPERALDAESLFGVLESNANALCRDSPEHCSPPSGGWAQTGIACRVRPEDPRQAEPGR